MPRQHDAPRLNIARARHDIAPDLGWHNANGRLGERHFRVFRGNHNIARRGHAQTACHGRALQQKHNHLRH